MLELTETKQEQSKENEATISHAEVADILLTPYSHSVIHGSLTSQIRVPIQTYEQDLSF
jgi:hypothetical protein